MKKSLGIQMYSMRKKLAEVNDPRIVFRKIKEAGYDSVQGDPSHGMTPKQYKNALSDIGLFPLVYPAYIGGAEGGILGILQNPDFVIKGANAFEVKIVEVATILSEYRGSEDDFARFAGLMNLAARPLAKEGIKLLYHNHALEFHRFPSGKTGLDVLVNETDPELVEFCLDIHWMQAGGVDSALWIRKLSGRMSLIHYKDYGIELNVQNAGIAPKTYEAVGEGNINWGPIAEASRDANIIHYVVEQDDSNRDIYDCITSSAKYIRNTLDLID
ncbi:sugar phosphate isomerase/epimerase family protein [Leadbettera azotonutricia]|uniref:Sugar phosphate isomerase/epimerase n=1 Tax=Leadbettera azotonutricia (strain ATCC BAA-888 / DSM 13862 / ZAS-9) TaxID=545695 RepID=F5Y894_LEAAZ|nr:sugar phosphate isomerase/epimerase [Leadbettera azotonutricia]AEF80073.1 sugar phosphate isomerase/epimerase [Leadbettera azotonutricia ZAS-9]